MSDYSLYAKDMSTAPQHIKPAQAMGKSVRAVYTVGSGLTDTGGIVIAFTDGTLLLTEGVCPPRLYHKWPWEGCIEAGLVTQAEYDERRAAIKRKEAAERHRAATSKYKAMLEALERYAQEHGIETE